METTQPKWIQIMIELEKEIEKNEKKGMCNNTNEEHTL